MKVCVVSLFGFLLCQSDQISKMKNCIGNKTVCRVGG